MDVSDILTSQASKHKSILVEKDIPPDIDPSFLTVTDTNAIDNESYVHERETYLQANARDGIQLLIAALFSLPTLSSPEGPLAQLPAPTTQLPRAKPLPKPKPVTKWEKFARAKGIHSQRRDRKVWDEESQTWVARWGWRGKNKTEESQWLHEVPANADTDYDPSKEARAARRAQIAKNERQRTQNLARSQQGQAVRAPIDREQELERTLATTRASTASMGKFDRMLEGEKKPRGVKRKFEPIERSVEAEKSASLALLKKLGNGHRSSKKAEQDPSGESIGDGNILNVRKAVRFASHGQGAVALAHKSGTGRNSRQKRKGKQ
ncbi:ribosome biogenesis regulatory protein-domain-containing protein [Russula earlei]|uniref:Ribosome biogenesis regulatory protein-domain-containing protein n=1 Tax=Russula earlei TaxID=71964 RepID=A0ACC0U3F9_9AGAM|nr:ribosome biogenesis regulatory protein-domain-containing protein [Russula earlei]